MLPIHAWGITHIDHTIDIRYGGFLSSDEIVNGHTFDHLRSGLAYPQSLSIYRSQLGQCTPPVRLALRLRPQIRLN